MSGSLSNRLEEVITSSLKACRRLADDSRLEGKVSFNGESMQIILNDRLGAANDNAAFEALKSELDPILDRLYGGSSFEIIRDADARKPLTVIVAAAGEISPSQLLENLGS